MKRWKYRIISAILSVVFVSTMLVLPNGTAYAANSKEQGNYIFNSEDTITLNDNYRFDLRDKALLKKLDKITHVIVDERDFNFGRLTSYFLNIETLEFTKNTLNIEMAYYYHDFGMLKLKSIKVAPENPAYESKDGVLYTKNLKRLVYYPHCGNTEVTIPKETMIIGEKAFKNAPITSITFSNGLVLIEKEAFANTKLTKLSLPQSFRTINEGAFLNTPLSDVTIDAANSSLCSIDGAVYTKNLRQLYYWPEEKAVEDLVLPEGLTYLDCSKIKKIDQAKSITIPASLTAIVHTENNQFEKINLASNNKYFKMYDGVMYSSNEKLIRLYPNQNTDTQIVINPKLEYFPMNLFYADNSTTSITLPKGLKGFEGEAEWGKIRLGGFIHLSEVKFDGANANFSFADGILYDKNKTKLLWYPIDLGLKTYTIPATVKSIENDQLVKQNNLEKLTISKQCKLYDYSKFVNDYEQYYEMPVGKFCLKLKEFAVAKDNKDYTVIDGVLFSKDKIVLEAYPCAKTDKSYTIPEGVTAAPFGGYNPYLETLTVASTVNRLAVDMTIEMNEDARNGLLNFTALKEIKVNPKNPEYVARDGVLYRDYSMDYLLIIYPVGKTDTEFKLPTDLRTIEGVEYFEKNPYIKKIIIDGSNTNPTLVNGELDFTYDHFDYKFKNIELCVE